MTTPSPLFQAVSDGNLSKIQSLLELNPELIHARNEFKISLLMWTVYNRQTDILQYLLSKKNNLDIFEAAAVGDVRKVAQHLERNPELINSYSPDGFTPLGYATFFGHPETTALLLTYGADVNRSSRNSMSVYPIHSAVANRNADTAFALTELLISHNADVNVVQRGGWTPLHQAAAHGNRDLIILLLRNGADKKRKSDDGGTPLDLAIANRHESIIQILKSDFQ
ncbi:MAG TPA: ankyrin repeat domain-containing protein [Balneolales bacterium]|nr:ankyrin repeat domain-containing protein [Balneolales bacterium]